MSNSTTSSRRTQWMDLSSSVDEKEALRIRADGLPPHWPFDHSIASRREWSK
ncbi:hypothetical protein CERSUDRAFT_88971 [Gelatoporia subvermispora B]|uniref:Uncharacterized protein n=1 Tax=Ceriporiopsis subvermispora (strain B) TaxID=914234 RepID=M2QHR0_CERS8|nr:hypothetical protein CERSUDRAFT_88971 [Gelatoporia subvermispora B]